MQLRRPADRGHWPRKGLLRALVLAPALALQLAVAQAGTAQGFPPDDYYWRKYDPNSSQNHPTFQDVSVHDPSVIRVGNDYYMFGSHLAEARTTDLMHWQLLADGVDANNPLFDNVVTELADVFDWSGVVDLWANDVIQLGDGRFYMYYNLSSIDAPRASLGLAVADDVEGKYSDEGIFLQSGMTGISDDGVNPYDPKVHPNTVDPDTFYDHDGNLWMVYGSFSGGIFILEMDPATGMPMPNQGYGKHLMGGNHARIEGPTVLYSPDTGYYYLFVTFGGLSADGGYNIRVARSVSPDGPYYDAMGNDMADVKANPNLPLFDDASIEPYAQKLMGNFLFQREIGEPGADFVLGKGIGYVSPGGVSPLYDLASGRYFLVFHTRYPFFGELFQDRVHEMFMNEDGWPVVAPYRYAPYGYTPYRHAPYPYQSWPQPAYEYKVRTGDRYRCVQEGRCRYSEYIYPAQVAGDYKFVNHGKNISADIKESTFISLQPDGSITGEASGQWFAESGNRITLDIDGAGLFKGVVAQGWSEVASQWVRTFTAQSEEGISVWGSQLPHESTEEVLQDIVADLTLNEVVTADLQLPTEATRLATISWHSSDPNLITNDGQVTRPAPGEADGSVTLKATIHYAGETATKKFELVVPARSADGLLAHYAFEGDLTDASAQSAAGAVSGNLIGAGGGDIAFAPGQVGQAAVFDGNSGVRLPDGLISGSTYSVAMWLNPAALSTFTTTFFGARDPDHWVSLVPSGTAAVSGATEVWSGTAWYDAGVGTTIGLNQWTHVAFTVDQGALKVYINGQQRFSGSGFPDVFTDGSGIFSLGVNWWDPAYQGMMDELYVYEVALTAQQVADLAAQ